LVQAGREVLHGEDFCDVGVLALWGAVGIAIALVRFSWTPAAATT
jgi:hypothetical protein